MYLDFYGLKNIPFDITSNPRVFFESSSHKEALASLLYGIHQRKGIILMTGEVGTGKTTLCKTLLTQLPSQIKTSLILNPYFSSTQLLQAITEDFGLQITGKNRLEITKQLNTFLLNIHIEGGNAVIIIDEAQNLSTKQLEQIRLLSNLETSYQKLLQIILVGQPELKEKLNQLNLRQIRQRIFVKYNLCPLKEAEIKDYIEFRLKKSGETSIDILPESYKIIYEFSGGIPRLINMLFDRALLFGFANEKKVFDENVFKKCWNELK